jgi:isopenicillin N synthase-like dioxygenase
MLRAARSHCAVCLRLAREILAGLAKDSAALADLHAEDETFDGALLRVYRYNSCRGAAPAGAGGEDALYPSHVDLGLLTLAPASSSPALQICPSGGDGAWVPIECSMGSDELLVFGGAMLAHATGGALEALSHRVGVPDADTRLSAPYFFRASLDAHLPGWMGGAEPRITARDFISTTRKARVREWKAASAARASAGDVEIPTH